MVQKGRNGRSMGKVEVLSWGALNATLRWSLDRSLYTIGTDEGLWSGQFNDLNPAARLFNVCVEDRLEGKGWRQGDYIRDCWDRAGRRKLGQGQGLVSKQRCKYWEEALRALGRLLSSGWGESKGEKARGVCGWSQQILAHTPNPTCHLFCTAKKLHEFLHF